jgi:hypothetical protein
VDKTKITCLHVSMNFLRRTSYQFDIPWLLNS